MVYTSLPSMSRKRRWEMSTAEGLPVAAPEYGRTCDVGRFRSRRCTDTAYIVAMVLDGCGAGSSGGHSLTRGHAMSFSQLKDRLPPRRERWRS